MIKINLIVGSTEEVSRWVDFYKKYVVEGDIKSRDIEMNIADSRLIYRDKEEIEKLKGQVRLLEENVIALSAILNDNSDEEVIEEDEAWK